MQRIILASRSPRRKKLLEQLGLAFEIFPSSVAEQSDKTEPDELVRDLALQKALDVAGQCNDSLIIGADTIVVHNNNILEKPGDKQEAYGMLSELSGKTHSVFTGVAFVMTGTKGTELMEKTFSVETKVTFSTLTPREILSYVESGSPMDKAGAYGIQDDWGALFVEKISGDYYNVVGFPLNRFYRELKSFNPEFILSAN